MVRSSAYPAFVKTLAERMVFGMDGEYNVVHDLFIASKAKINKI